MSLSVKESAFCAEYAREGHGTKSAILAGYAERSAHVAASRMLKKDKIKKEIMRLTNLKIDKVVAQSVVDAAWILNKLTLQYEKADHAGDTRSALAALGLAGKHVAVQAFNEKSTVDVGLSALSNEELEARHAAAKSLKR
jgi:hypothetical protein